MQTAASDCNSVKYTYSLVFSKHFELNVAVCRGFIVIYI